MDFEYTWKLLHLLWIVPLFGLLVYTAAYKRKKILEKIFGKSADFTENSTLSPGKRYLRLWLLLAAIVLLAVAIARPRWGWRILPFSDRGRDLMIVLDVSKSMNSEDIRPTRLKHAKLFIRNLIKSNPGDRFGLIAFAGSAFLECPLTVDKTSIFQTLDEINTDSIPLGGTNIENALDTALLAFQAAEGGYRAIVLISDGDELSGNSSKALTTLKNQKIPLFVVGIGNPSGDGLIKMTGPDGKTHLLRDSQGKLVKSKLNELQLKKLSTATDGIYVRSTAREPELDAINKRVHELVPKEYSKGSSKRPIEKFHYPLCAAVILLLIRFGIGERRRDTMLSLFLIMVVMTSFTPEGYAQAEPSPRKIEKELPLGDSIKDQKNTDKKIQGKETPAELYNRALKLHTENKTEEASKLYKIAVNMSKVAPEVRSKAFQNLGVITHQKARAVMQKDPDEALKIMDYAEVMYKEAMRSDTKRKRVVLNQQKLIDDRKLAKLIKKRKEELKKKQQQAQKKTKEAHDQQKKENQNKKQQQKKKEEQQKQQQKKKEQQKQKQNQKKQEQKQNQKKQGQNKQNQKKNENKNQQKKKQQADKNRKNGDQNNRDSSEHMDKKTEKKIQEAEKACRDLKNSAEKNKRPDLKKQAEAAEKELKKAEEEHKKGNGQKSEEHLKKAMDKLKSEGKKQKNSNKDKQQKNQKDQNKKEKQNKDKKNNKGDQKKPEGDRKLEKQKQQKSQQNAKNASKTTKEKPIDPRQAATLLELMANDEKTLRDKLKENQKRNSRVKKVLKDW
jgi:Ca-activated chloride channel family protein